MRLQATSTKNTTTRTLSFLFLNSQTLLNVSYLCTLSIPNSIWAVSGENQPCLLVIPVHLDLIMNTHPDLLKWLRLQGHHTDILYSLNCVCCDQPAHVQSGHNIHSLLIAK